MILLAFFPYYEKVNGGLRDHLSVYVSVYHPQRLKAGILEPEDACLCVCMYRC
jgi:hypothetical protein